MCSSEGIHHEISRFHACPGGATLPEEKFRNLMKSKFAVEITSAGELI